MIDISFYPTCLPSLSYEVRSPYESSIPKLDLKNNAAESYRLRYRYHSIAANCSNTRIRPPPWSPIISPELNGNLMARYDFRSPRLFVAAPLRQGAALPLGAAQAHYLVGVLRLKAGDPVLVFNGIEGEWKAHLAAKNRQQTIVIECEIRSQTAPGDLHYLFSPLKHARLDYMVQKAVEMGASRLQPVIMRHTVAARVNLDRMRANAVEAAEQCGILSIPEIAAPVGFENAVAGLESTRHLVFCDEEAPTADPVLALRAALGDIAALDGLAVVIGPEGGFSDDERDKLLGRPLTVRIALGPRILRADTAAVAALAVVQAAVGDWR
jgi:16S rRNA (uracil1498-N3)-methyltransferase